jgi:fructokinase
MKNTHKYIIALDIGGTKIEGVLFNKKYKILKKKRIYYQKKHQEAEVKISRKAFLDLVNNLIDELIDGLKIYGIAVSIPDIITKDGSIQGKSKILSLSNFAIAKYFKNKYKCKVKVANDADCFAIAEYKFGAGRGCKNMVGVIYGTGIGAGLILNGKIYRSTTGGAGEFGHNQIDPSGPKDRTGLNGTVEAFAGGADFIKAYIKAGGKFKNPKAEDIFYSKEKIAYKIVDNSLEKFAIGLAQLMNILNPDIIVIGGGLSKLPIYKKLNKLTKKYTFDVLKKNVKIVKNKLGDFAGVYGAALIFFE